MKKASGFTLVEILIVVVILGILAAIVIPQFTNASTQAKESRLTSDLQSMRSQIELFKIQHNDDLPGQVDASFLICMTGYTDEDSIEVASDANGVFGPYVQKIPSNPWVKDSADAVTVTEGTAAPGSGPTGWYFNTDTSAFNANDTGTTEEGVAHSAL